MLSVVLPCFNEEKNIANTVRDVQAWMRERGIAGEVIAVNDGSADGTQAELERMQKESSLRIVRHEKNQGYGAAIRSGCDAAHGDIFSFMDSDGQFRAEDLSKLLPMLEKMDFVTGRRRKRADPFLRKVNAKLFGFLVWIILGVWVRDINCGMKIFRRSLWSTIRPAHATGALFNAEVFYRLKRSGVAWAQVDVPHYPRKFGNQTGADAKVILRMFRELWALKNQ